MGIDLAGTVTALGEGVTQFAVGDDVFGSGVGTLAEFACAKEARIVRKPQSLTFESAASIPCAGVTALQALRKGDVQPGQSVLVNGAAGGVGTFAVQIAKSMGANVTGVCSARNEELVRSIGAHDVVDYAKDDFTRLANKYDVVLDVVGNRSLSDLRRALTPDGTLLLAAGAKGKWLRPVALLLKGVAISKFVHQRISPVMANITQLDLLALAALSESGELAPVIDRTFALSESAEAIRYLEEGHARGKVVVAV
jgi:NADPH:quinone reductase-like Zn-dependent oxidoreductase